ncbi:MAG: hypothetical protein QW272_07925 [Candidatus Methanomethylicaceae archaeon]
MRRNLLAIGFIFSTITDVCLFLVFPFLLAFGTYPLSIILRGVGWIKLGKESKFKIFTVTGVGILILGFSFYIMMLSGITESLLFIIMPWVIYSLMEFSSYIKVNKVFGVKLIGIAMIIFMSALPLFPRTPLEGEQLLQSFRYAFIPLLVSSIITAISFLRK